tara:strand:- start:2226 stop:2651 length:426 start_codon:yes stop_codon:yes gene_type:complete
LVKLFIYGTLQDTVLLAKITRSRDIDDGYEVYDQLDGYTTVRHSCMPYPTIQAQTNGLVTGKVLNVTDRQLSILDSYESILYEKATIKTRSGRECLVYIESKVRVDDLIKPKVKSIVDSVDGFEFDDDKSSEFYFDPEDKT